MQIDLSTLSVEQLAQLASDVAAELERRQHGARPIKVRLTLGRYNDRRYAKPWIGQVVEWSGAKTELAWGTWIGTADEGGDLVVEVTPGSVIRYGQKDLRRADKSTANFAVVDAEGIHPVDTATARRYFDGEQVELPPAVPASELRV